MLFSFDESKLPKVANPEHAERTIERWVANAPNTNFSKAVVDSSANLKLFRAIAGNSPFLAQCLQRDAAFTSTLLQRGPNDIFDEIIASLRALMDTKFDSVKLMATLREAKRNAALTIAVGDISGVWDVDKVMDALSTFADESISTATRYVLRHHANAGRIPDLNKEDPEKEELIKFESEIAELFNLGKIRAPIHLYHGNEEQIINIFKKIKKNDWVFCSWRSHYQCLLKGVPKKNIKEEILSGRSISLCFPKYNIYSSAMVGGSIPIAVGTAMSLKRKNSENKVFCFMGEMTSETGIAHECVKYSRNFKLPIHFIVEDNEKSVCTDTRKAWNQKKLSYEGSNDEYVTYYHYKLKYPHAGAGKRVQF